MMNVDQSMTGLWANGKSGIQVRMTPHFLPTIFLKKSRPVSPELVIPTQEGSRRPSDTLAGSWRFGIPPRSLLRRDDKPVVQNPGLRRNKFDRPVALIALLLLSWVPLLQAQDGGKEQLVVPLSEPGKPGFLTVGLVNGSIHVTGYTGKDVVIDASTNSRRDKKDDDEKGRGNASGMKRIAGGASLELTAEEKDNRIKVSSDSWKHAVNLTIKVPQRFSLKLETVNDGDIVVENVQGELEISNVNGGVQLSDVSGSAVANTVNGAMTVKFKDITANAPMAFTTLNGRVDVTFPTNLKATVKLKSDRGDIYSDFDLAVEKSQPKVDRSGQGGMYRVSVEDWTYGKINGGGPEILMKTMNGNIYLRKVK